MLPRPILTSILLVFRLQDMRNSKNISHNIALGTMREQLLIFNRMFSDSCLWNIKIKSKRLR